MQLENVLPFAEQPSPAGPRNPDAGGIFQDPVGLAIYFCNSGKLKSRHPGTSATLELVALLGDCRATGLAGGGGVASMPDP
jgi:hypothetical protein